MHNSTIHRYNSTSCCTKAVWLISSILITSALHYLMCSFDYYSNLWPGLHFTRDFSVHLSCKPNPHYSIPFIYLLSFYDTLPLVFPLADMDYKHLTIRIHAVVTALSFRWHTPTDHLKSVNWPSDIIRTGM